MRVPGQISFGGVKNAWNNAVKRVLFKLLKSYKIKKS